MIELTPERMFGQPVLSQEEREIETRPGTSLRSFGHQRYFNVCEFGYLSQSKQCSPV